jgi:hypothetical protein
MPLFSARSATWVPMVSRARRTCSLNSAKQLPARRTGAFCWPSQIKNCVSLLLMRNPAARARMATLMHEYFYVLATVGAVATLCSQGVIPPCLQTAAKVAPSGDEWLHEVNRQIRQTGQGSKSGWQCGNSRSYLRGRGAVTCAGGDKGANAPLLLTSIPSSRVPSNEHRF